MAQQERIIPTEINNSTEPQQQSTTVLHNSAPQQRSMRQAQQSAQ